MKTTRISKNDLFAASLLTAFAAFTSVIAYFFCAPLLMHWLMPV